jgi:hypothetical protein
MNNFFTKINNKLQKKYDKQTSTIISKKLTQMYHQIDELQSVPENTKTIAMIDDNKADFDVVRRCVERVFSNEYVNCHLNSDIM